MRGVNYDERQHAQYRRGRELPPDRLALWIETFARHAPDERPIAVLDLGSGTGRFTPALAEAFGGPVYGVEPSQKMRELAEKHAAHPAVTYIEGRAESIPLRPMSVDLVLMYLSFHHVRDREAAAAEVARVLRPGSRVFLRSTFSDRIGEMEWMRYFPRVREIEAQMFPSSKETVGLFARAGLQAIALVTVEEQLASSLAEYTARLRMRAISTFEYMTEDEILEGFARLDAALAQETQCRPVIRSSDLLVLGRAG